MEQLRQVAECAEQILPQLNLIINETKTVIVKVSFASKAEKDYQDQPLINNKTWHSRKSLGSLSCFEKKMSLVAAERVRLGSENLKQSG